MLPRFAHQRSHARLLAVTAVLVLLGPFSAAPSRAGIAGASPVGTSPGAEGAPALPRLPVPAGGEIPVAFVIAQDAEVLDFCGPLEVFASPWTADGHPVFKPYFVAASRAPVTVGGGMRVVPDYTFADAPAPKVIVIPAMRDDTTAGMIDWIREASKGADVTMSVCNGAFVLAKTGLLDGKPATAHHGGYFRFAGRFPKVQLQRGARYVEIGNIASAGGISSGIDLSLRVVERYVGRTEVEAIVEGMEYQGTGWLDPGSNAAFARLPETSAQSPVCPLCQMAADTTISSVHDGRTYYFCASSEKAFFDAHPEVVDRFLAEDAARDAREGR